MNSAVLSGLSEKISTFFYDFLMRAYVSEKSDKSDRIRRRASL
jgi:hypothetical protein